MNYEYQWAQVYYRDLSSEEQGVEVLTEVQLNGVQVDGQAQLVVGSEKDGEYVIPLSNVVCMRVGPPDQRSKLVPMR